MSAASSSRKGRLDELVPIENAAMEDRTVICWDKDDIDALGILKVDVLALGMLTCLRKGFDLIAAHHGTRYTLATLPPEEPEVYDMLCRADSLGVFQVESRAQMNFLPRMRPRCFYDLVIEVAIVRPGPIQGDMVHPYLRRRRGDEPVEFPSDALGGVLGKTLGVPLFQEQAMQIAIIGAGFTPEEADRLRRALATFKKTGTIHTFRERFLEGMARNGYPAAFAERCFSQIEGFGEYGFPESHAASFALLVYASAWMKRRHPGIFACALLNSQPMGFYAPAQIVRDAREHGVEVRPVCINASYWNCVDGARRARRPRAAPRLPPDPRAARGGGRLDRERAGNGYGDVAAVWRRAGTPPRQLARLAEADAFAALGLTRREALWQARAIRGEAPLPLFDGIEGEGEEGPVRLPPMTLGEEVVADYRALRLTLRAHPMALIRHLLTPPEAWSATPGRRRAWPPMLHCSTRQGGPPADMTSAMTEKLPILFLHGAFAGPEVWTRFVAPWFTARGHRVAVPAPAGPGRRRAAAARLRPPRRPRGRGSLRRAAGRRRPFARRSRRPAPCRRGPRRRGRPRRLAGALRARAIAHANLATARARRAHRHDGRPGRRRCADRPRHGPPRALHRRDARGLDRRAWRPSPSASRWPRCSTA
jgi:hypothetical protein